MRIWLYLALYILLLGVVTYLLTHRVKEPQVAISPVTPAAARHGFVCTTPLTPTLRPERKAGWV